MKNLVMNFFALFDVITSYDEQLPVRDHKIYAFFYSNLAWQRNMEHEIHMQTKRIHFISAYQQNSTELISPALLNLFSNSSLRYFMIITYYYYFHAEFNEIVFLF